MDINEDVAVLAQGSAMDPKGNTLQIYFKNKVNALMIT